MWNEQSDWSGANACITLSYSMRRILCSYVVYYNSCQAHLALDNDTPVSRSKCGVGPIRSRPILGGLHHRNVRI
jgi:hypothetical protein